MWKDEGLHSAGRRVFDSVVHLVLPPQAAAFPSPLFITSLLLLCSLFLFLFYGHRLSVGNMSSGTENITEVTETTLASTPTVTQQQETYVLYLCTHTCHMHYINQGMHVS